MSSKLHDLIFFHSLGKPVTKCRVPQVLEPELSNVRSDKNFSELKSEIVDHLQSSVGKSPFALFAKSLNVVVAIRRNKHIRITFRLLILMIRQHHCNLLSQRQDSAIGILHIP